MLWSFRAVWRVGAVSLGVLLAGCAGYTKDTADTMAAVSAGDIQKALQIHEKKAGESDRDLLFYLEKGEMQRLTGAYQDSTSTFLLADTIVRAWEEDARTDAAKLMGEIGSFLYNDTVRPYEGRDYEKVLLSVRLALNHLAVGRFDLARTEIKKMHEREATIADFRAKELDAAKKAASEKGLKATSYKDLNGYPVQTLDAPEVRALKNSYESAFANYLAGFIYEALQEPSLAAPGYRKAAEMLPNVDLIDNGLAGLDKRLSASAKGTRGVDTLFVIETGFAPRIDSVQIPIFLPIPGQGGISLVATPISWPTIHPMTVSSPATVVVNGRPLRVVPLTSVELMARRALADEMPGIIARSSVRAITRGAAQVAMEQGTANTNAAVIGQLFSLATKIAAVATEQADERIWRMLPGSYAIARMTLPPGHHQLVIGGHTQDFDLGGKYAVIALRLLGDRLYIMPERAPEPAVPPAVVNPAAAPADIPVAGKKKKKVKASEP